MIYLFLQFLSLSHDKIDRINSTHQTELEYWKKAALERALDQNDVNEFRDLAPPILFLVREATKNVRKMNINEIICYLKSRYSGNENQVAFNQRYRGEHSLDESHLKTCLRNGECESKK